MQRAAKAYIYSVIGAGGFVLAGSLFSGAPASFLAAGSPIDVVLGAGSGVWLWALFIGLAVLASIVKLRLPGVEGTYSLSFLFLLYGVAHLPLPETLLAGCAGVAAQSILNAKKRPTPVQILFNTANVAISVAACFLVGRVWLADGMVRYTPAVTAIVACTYFVVNTVLVSGVLALLQSKPVADVCGQWYVWSFPYYLIGVTLVGLIPSPGRAVFSEGWLIVLPLLYLLHFFLGLVTFHATAPPIGEQANGSLPARARILLGAVLTACLSLLAAAVIGWNSQNLTRFLIYLALGVLASTCKIRLPRMRGTLTPAFVLLLAAIAQLSFAEIVIMAFVLGLVQVLWRSARPPMFAQILFGPACAVASSALAYVVSRLTLEAWLGPSVVGVVVVSVLVLYLANTLLVATMLALVDGKPLGDVWRLCYFWSLPYYLVGAAAAGIMTAVSRTADWPPSLLVLPMMTLVFVSYRTQLTLAAARSEMAAQESVLAPG